MNTKRFFRSAMLAIGLFIFQSGNGQVSTTNNFPFAPGSDYVGWDGNTNVPLMVRHNNNQRIEWYTDSLLRMLLTPTLPNQNWAWWQGGNLDFSGHLGLGDQTPTTPLTYLHINHGLLNSISVGYRPWMRTGMFCSEASDAMYVGLRSSTANRANAIINWSDDAGGPNPDPLRFIFSSTPDSSNTARTFEGLEIARMIPANNGNEGFLGVGDYFTAALQPTERVDLLDGRMRIRELPNDSAAVDSFLVMVVDRTLGGERGVVKWIDPNDLPGGDDCDWVVQNPSLHVSSVYDGTSCDWDRRHGVGIGVSVPKSKLMVYHTDSELLNPIAVWGASRFDFESGEVLIGVAGEARQTNTFEAIKAMQAYGVSGVAEGAARSYGVYGGATVALSGNGVVASNVVGVTGVAEANNNSAQCIGVYGQATGAIGLNNWAIFSNGSQFSTTLGTWSTSDEQFKANVETITDALGLILQLQPRKYSYNTEQFPYMHFDDGPQYGLIAQEMEVAIPELVRDVFRPSDVDSLGNELIPALEFKAVNYERLLPLVIGAVQEQHAILQATQGSNEDLLQRINEQEVRLNEQEARLSQLEQVLANCCAAHGNDADQRIGSIDNSQVPDPATERLLTIAPNPFTDRTTVSYTLERGGRAQLLVNSSDGKHLQVLEEGVRSEGQYNYAWSTAHLAPGVYYVTLLLDGEPLVKRAVKVQ